MPRFGATATFMYHGVTRPFIGAVPLSRHAKKCYWTCKWVSENVTSREAITSKNTKSRLFRKKIWYFFTHEVPITQHWDKCEKNTPFEKKIKEGVKIKKMEKWKTSVFYKLIFEQLDIFHFLIFSNFTPTLIFFSKTCDVTLFSLSDFELKLKAKNEKLGHHWRF